MQKGCGEIGTPNVRGKRRCQQECQFFNSILRKFKFGTVFLAERANFLIQIFLEKKYFEKSIKQWTPTNRGLTCLSLPQAPEEKRRKRKQKKAKQGENRLGVPIFIENLGQ